MYFADVQGEDEVRVESNACGLFMIGVALGCCLNQPHHPSPPTTLHPHRFPNNAQNCTNFLANDLVKLQFKMPTLRRIQQEYRNLRDDPVEGCTASPIDPSNLFSWQATIRGPPESPYESGTFHLTMEFPETYPRHPPTVTFTTRVYHPNIDSDNGYICINILRQDWCPVLTISSMLLSLRSFLDSPDVEDAYYPSMGKEYVERRDVFDEQARRFTEEFARGGE